jgi:aminopeptidase N
LTFRVHLFARHTRAKIAKFKQQKKARFEAKSGTGKRFLAFLFEEIIALKRQLNPEKTASSKKSTRES